MPNSLGKQGSVTITCTPLEDESKQTSIELNAYEPAALVFTADSQFSIKTANRAKNWDGTLYYSNEYYADNSMWSVWNGTDEIFSNKGIGEEKERIYIRGLGNSYLTGSQDNKKAFVVSFDGISDDDSRLATCNGPISSLLKYTAAENDKHIANVTVGNWGFGYLFYKCRIYSAPRINVNALHYSFHSMFSCSNLRIAPLIEWNMDFGDNGMHWTFDSCKYLETVPYISRYEASNDPYHGIFHGCNSMMVNRGSATAECPNLFWKSDNNCADAFSYTANHNGEYDVNSGYWYYTNLRVMKRPEWTI